MQLAYDIKMINMIMKIFITVIIIKYNDNDNDNLFAIILEFALMYINSYNNDNKNSNNI